MQPVAQGQLRAQQQGQWDHKNGGGGHVFQTIVQAEQARPQAGLGGWLHGWKGSEMTRGWGRPILRHRMPALPRYPR